MKWLLVTFMDRKGTINCPWSSSTNNSGYFYFFSLYDEDENTYAMNFSVLYWGFVSSGTLLFFCNSFFVAVFFAVQKVWSIRNYLFFLLFIPQWCEIISRWATFNCSHVFLRDILCFLNSYIKVWMLHNHLS